MGCLSHHKLEDYMDKYNLEYYFETGTGQAEALSHAVNYNFKKCYTVDIDEEMVELSYNKLKHRAAADIEFLIGKSTDILDEYVPQLPKESPTLFFLDAHFPGADFQKCTYEESIREHMQDAFPLEEEVNTILKHRDVSKDVFIIDDLVLYQKDAKVDCIREGVVWQYDWLQEELNLQTNAEFLYKAFEKTHDFKTDLRAQGYLIITPKAK
tara:strand:+ start:721 stop:1353 length:633 start_codon:yes stop_codon:yes gene_type:complete